MPIDASIYQNIKPAEIPSPLDAAQKGMALSQLGMQQAQMGMQMRTQSAMRQAYANNTGPDGQLNRQGFLNDLSKENPMAAADMQNQLVQRDKAAAEAQSAQVEAAHKTLGIIVPVLDHLAGMPEDQRAAAYPDAIKQIGQMGVPTDKIPAQYDPGAFRTAYISAKNAKESLDNQKTRAETGKALAESDKTRSETYKRNPDILGQTDDPAKLVPGYVPKEHQARAFEEIKTAQDINKLTPKILAAFEMGSSRNPITAAQGQREFEGLINTTVKDTEGTARQAAFDSIHKTMTPSGLTASPGENDTKKRTVLEYLSSKSAAPIALGYGIDLSKFKSTAPYQNDKTYASKSGSDSSLSPSEANASDNPVPSAQYTQALKWLKTADPGSPGAFKVRAILKSKGMLK